MSNSDLQAEKHEFTIWNKKGGQDGTIIIQFAGKRRVKKAANQLIDILNVILDYMEGSEI